MPHNKNIILHIGMCKTGTTFLQKKFFPFIKDIFCTSCNDGILNEKPFTDLHNLDRILFDNRGIKNTLYNNNYLHNYKEKLFEYFQNKIQQKTVLISHEAFAGDARTSFNNQEKNIKILKTLFPDAKILLLFRRQDKWIDSLYNEVVIKSRHLLRRYISLNSFIGYKNNDFHHNSKYINVYELNWYKLAKNWQNAFGEENVLILPYEMLRENQKEFLNIFYNFSKFKPFYPAYNDYINKSVQDDFTKNTYLLDFYIDLIYKIPEELRRKILKNDKGFQNLLSIFYTNIKTSSQKLSEEQKTKIINIQKENNIRLSEFINIDLKQYGYY